MKKHTVRSFPTLGLLVVLTCGITGAHAKTSFTVRPERTIVGAGESFQVTAQLKTDRNLGHFSAPALPVTPDFTVLNSSRYQSQSIHTGQKTTVEYTYQFVYTIASVKPGSFTFPALTLTVGKETVKSDPFSVTVREKPVSNPDVIVRLVPSTRKPYKGEQFTCAVKVATKPAGSIQLTNEGFSTFIRSLQEKLQQHFTLMDLSGGGVEKKQEMLNGETYIVYRMDFALFGLQPGKVTIGRIPFSFQKIEQISSRSRDPFDSFFGGSIFNRTRAVPQSTTSEPCVITVRALPPPPDNFAGSVGRFSLDATISETSVNAGDALNVTVTFSGNTRPGSIPDLTIEPIAGMEIFTPEVRTVVDTTQRGITTRKRLKYLMIPREQGEQIIPSQTWTYFNPEKGSYETAATPSFTVTVLAANSEGEERTRYLTQEDVRALGSDIRFIKQPPTLVSVSPTPYRNPVFILLLPVPFVLFSLALLYRFQAVRRTRNQDHLARKKAFGKALHALAALKKEEPHLALEQLPGRIRSIFDTYISGKCGFAAGGKTNDELLAALVRHGMTKESLSAGKVFLERLDLLRFGGTSLTAQQKDDLWQSTDSLLKRLDKELSRGNV